MKITTFRKRLLSQHKAQGRLFASTVKALEREYGKVTGSEQFLAPVKRLQELLDEQTRGIEAVWAAAELLPQGEGNRSPELFIPVGKNGPHCYTYLAAKRKIVEQIGDIDEWNKALSCSADMIDAAKPLKESQPKLWDEANEMSWHLGAAQYQIHALARQTEAITATQEAILRSYGLKIWQGRKRHLRWEGDDKSASE